MGSDPPEIFVLDGDGAVEPLPPDRPPRGPGAGARRWGAVLIGALLVFGLGFAAGRAAGYGSGYHTGYDAALADASSASDTPSGVAASMGPVARASSHPGPLDSAVVTAGEEKLGGETADDVCGSPRPEARVFGAHPLPASAPPLRLVAGVDGTVIDTAAAPASAGGAARDRLFPPDSASASLTFAVFESAGDVFGLARACDNPHDVRIRRATPTRPAHAGPESAASGFAVSSVGLPLRAGEQVTGFLTGSGAGPYFVADAQSAESGPTMPRLSLVEPDGARASSSLPAGFSPVGIAGGYVVGSHVPRLPGSDADSQGFAIQIVNPATGAVTAQLGPAAAQMLIAGDSVIWQPLCDGGCEIHRYVVATGEDSVVAAGPSLPVDSEPQWRAVSPDGSRIAMIVANPAGSRSTPQGSGSAFGVVVVDSASGRVDAARGVELPWPVASIAFSSDSRWLLVGVGTGNGGEVVAYDDDMRGPYEVARVPGAGGGIVPLALLPPS